HRGAGVGRTADRRQSLRQVRQGGEIPGDRSAARRLCLVLLPLGALWLQRPAAEPPLLILLDPITGQGARALRGLLRVVSSGCILALMSAGASAEELPIRKAGLWEMKITKIGSQLPELTMQHCTDATTDKDMANSVSPL